METPAPADHNDALMLDAARRNGVAANWLPYADGQWWLCHDGPADETPEERRRALDRIKVSARRWAARNGYRAERRQRDKGRRVWVRFTPVDPDAEPVIGRNGWTYQAAIQRFRTMSERHPSSGDNPTDDEMRLMEACNAFRQARLGLEPDPWDWDTCDIRDHVRAEALIRSLEQPTRASVGAHLKP